MNSGVIGINPGGTAVGSGGCYKPPFGAGFVRAPNGAMTIFNPPGSEYTSPFAINPAGAVTGYFCDGSGCHGFLRDPGRHHSVRPAELLFHVCYGHQLRRGDHRILL